MSETDWLECHDLYDLCKALKGIITERKFRLFGTTCCRRIWDLLDGDHTRRIVQVAEKAADGNAPLELLGAVWDDAYREVRANSDEDADPAYNLGWGGKLPKATIFAKSAADPDFGLWFYALGIAEGASERLAYSRVRGLQRDLSEQDEALVGEYRRAEEHYQERLLRDIFGNPFRPVAFDPRWRTADAVALARGIYEERAFERLPLLADALMDAGCADEHILGHCRSDGPHVRGCWVVDLVLGKE